MEDSTAHKIKQPDNSQYNNQVQEGIDIAFVISRAKEVLLSPKEVWTTISAETTTVKGIYMRYILVMAAIPVICEFIRMVTFGRTALFVTARWGFFSGLVTSIISYALQLVAVFVLAMVLQKLAPKFDGKLSLEKALQLVAYSMTAGCLGGIFALIPGLLIVQAALGIFSIYIFFQGVSKMTSVPDARKVAYSVVSAITAVVLFVIIGAITAIFTPGATASHFSSADGGAIKKLELPGGISIDTEKMKQFGKTIKQLDNIAPDAGK